MSTVVCKHKRVSMHRDTSFGARVQVRSATRIYRDSKGKAFVLPIAALILNFKPTLENYLDRQLKQDNIRPRLTDLEGAQIIPAFRNAPVSVDTAAGVPVHHGTGAPAQRRQEPLHVVAVDFRSAEYDALNEKHGKLTVTRSIPS